MSFRPGSVVRRREVLHGDLWMEQPVTVVSDVDGCLAVLVEPGSTFTFYEHSFGAHPWSGRACWDGNRVLQLHRDGDAYGVWKFFDLDGRLLHWYINFEAPVVRHVDATGGGAYDTDDHGVDIVIEADGSGWRWKDLDDPAAMSASGRITRDEEAQIMERAARLAAQLDAGDRWWSTWDDWVPPPYEP